MSLGSPAEMISPRWIITGRPRHVCCGQESWSPRSVVRRLRKRTGQQQRVDRKLSLGGVMGPLRELLAIDHRQALEFFVLRLQDVSEPTVDRQELLYNASLLAHYAQVSTQPDVDVPAPANLSAVFDHFVSDTTLLHDSLMMETAGAQCLLLAGFFEDQMRPTAQHPLVCRVGRGFLQTGGPSRAVPAQSPAARRHREALRAVASAPRAAEPRAARPALSADPAPCHPAPTVGRRRSTVTSVNWSRNP